MPPDRARSLQERLMVTFRREADDHLAVLGRELDGFQCDAPEAELGERLEVLFRTMHTLKGASRSVGLTEIESVCHLCEALLRSLRETLLVTPETVRVLQDACDAVAGLVGGELAPGRIETVSAQLLELSPPGSDTGLKASDRPSAAPAPSPPAGAAESASPKARETRQTSAAPEAATAASPAPAPSPAVEQSGTRPPASRPSAAGADLDTMRVEVGRFNKFSVLAEELLIPKLAAADRVRMARNLSDALGQVRECLRASQSHSATDADPRTILAAVDERVRMAESAGRQMLATLRNDHKTMRMTVDGLLSEVRHIRMIPASHTLEAFPRMVRDLARDTGKDVALELSGTDVEIDRKIIELIKDPLIHMVRNAVDHGIEAPVERRNAGKPAQGKVKVAIQPTADGRVAISVSDDGSGMDAAAIRSAAVRARAISTEQAQRLSDDDAIDLAFRSGVSTSPVVSSISGNGIGLAIVRERIERVEGRLHIQSSPGLGSTITLDLPTSVATYRGFLVGAGTGKVLWPFDGIERAIGVPESEVAASLARGSFVFEEQTLPIGRLSGIMGYEARAADRPGRRKAPAIVVRSGDRRGILLVDEVIGESEIVIKELRPPLRRVQNVMTVGLLGTGELVLVARPSDVLASINVRGRHQETSSAPKAVRTIRLLVVDDSITTRTMERNMFEAAGYRVKTAADGMEALTLLQNEEFDLIVSDIDMPRMNGFELTQCVRATNRLSQIPIILVTALESRDDKERGIRVGANAYVQKSGFNQSNLLEIVRRLT